MKLIQCYLEFALLCVQKPGYRWGRFRFRFIFIWIVAQRLKITENEMKFTIYVMCMHRCALQHFLVLSQIEDNGALGELSFRDNGRRQGYVISIYALATSGLIQVSCTSSYGRTSYSVGHKKCHFVFNIA